MIFLTQKELLPPRDHLVVFFYTQEMPFYGKVLDLLAILEKKYPSYLFYAVDAHYFTELCKTCAVQHVPQLIVFRHGREVDRLCQTVRTKDFSRFLADICLSGNLNTENT